MSEAVEASLADACQLIVEAGTGVGKTFAYLVAALTSGRRVVISTGTKHLQDQLYFKDLPTILKILERPAKTALLKGRANYICLYRLHHHAARMSPYDKRTTKKIRAIEEWSAVTKTGEIAEVTDLGEEDTIWPHVTSTVENCLGGECPDYQDCHVVKARQKAQKADVAIINHHLFFADLALKEGGGMGELLPDADAFIFDEAHQLPELASIFFSITVSARQLKNLASDVRDAQPEEAPDAGELRDAADTLDRCVANFRLALAGLGGRKPWHEAMAAADAEDRFDQLYKSVDGLADALLKPSERGKVLGRCATRCARIKSDLARISEGDEAMISWLEIFDAGFKLHGTPLVVADAFRAFTEQYSRSWIFTSATLTVNTKFDHFQNQLGLTDAHTLTLDSPYDYRANTRLFLPPIHRAPHEQGYTREVVDAVLPVLETNRGRAFLLFTSYRALHRAAEYLRDWDDFTLLVQGEAPRRELLATFADAEHAVLLGTNSFWEGVDVRGDALSCVVIDKLPFAAPDDPVLVGRLQALRHAGENPFISYQLPQAVIALKQGVGRLIRSEEDYGVVAICDPRITTKFYGKSFINSLPDMPRTSDLDAVVNFLRRECAT